MPDYYVTVTKLGTANMVVPLCGHLYARSLKKAEEEVKEYRKQVNGYWPVEVMGDEWLVVTVQTGTLLSRMKYFRQYKNKRVTPDPKATTQPQKQSRKTRK